MDPQVGDDPHLQGMTFTFSVPGSERKRKRSGQRSLVEYDLPPEIVMYILRFLFLQYKPSVVFFRRVCKTAKALVDALASDHKMVGSLLRPNWKNAIMSPSLFRQFAKMVKQRNRPEMKIRISYRGFAHMSPVYVLKSTGREYWIHLGTWIAMFGSIPMIEWMYTTGNAVITDGFIYQVIFKAPQSTCQWFLENFHRLNRDRWFYFGRAFTSCIEFNRLDMLKVIFDATADRRSECKDQWTDHHQGIDLCRTAFMHDHEEILEWMHARPFHQWPCVQNRVRDHIVCLWAKTHPGQVSSGITQEEEIQLLDRLDRDLPSALSMLTSSDDND